MPVVVNAPQVQARKGAKKNKNNSSNKAAATLSPSQAAISSEALSYELLQEKCLGEEKQDDDSIDSGSTAEPSTEASTQSECDEDVKEEDVKDDVKEDVEEEPSTNKVELPGKKDLEFLKVVNIGSQDPKTKVLLKAVTALSDLIFHEDCLEDCTKKKGWKLSILTNKEQSIMCGFITTKVTATGSLAVGKLAVPGEFRGAGYGRKIMEEIVKDAKRQKGVYDVSLSSLPGAISFYQRIGFKAHWGLKLTKDNDGYVEGQVYMEKLLARRPRKQ
mmetsp:Transcript_50243/g.106750  ORF Transcript_50243/g.106750 Transcript_50243/m.106750 type:complete len:274 (-) Transcript_50243:471-1292(-)